MINGLSQTKLSKLVSKEVVAILNTISTSITSDRKALKESKNRILLWNGEELQFHCPRPKGSPLELGQYIPEACKSWPLEVEIGPGKGELLAARARAFPNHYFIGIDRRVDRVRLSENKLKKFTDQKNLAADELSGPKNWTVLREDARCFLSNELPKLDGLHLYQPDPWPKDRHHKHRFFRSPDAQKWAAALKVGGFFSFSTDHNGYFQEMIDIVKTWGFLEMNWAWKKTRLSGPAKTHFEGIFLRQNKPVYKALYSKIE